MPAHSLWGLCISRSRRRRRRGLRGSHRIRPSPERSWPITSSASVGGALSRSRASPLTRAVTRCGPGGHGRPARQPAGHRRPRGRPRPEDPAGRQHHRRRPGQDRLPTEPGHRLNRGGRPRHRRRDPQESSPLLHRTATGTGHPGVPGLPGGAGHLRPPEPDSHLRRRIGDVLPTRELRSPTGDCAPAHAFWRQTQSSPRKYVLAVKVLSTASATLPPAPPRTP